MGFPSVVRFSIDAEAKVILRNLSDGPETASSVETAIGLDTLRTAYWHNNEVPQQDFAAILHVTALDTVTGDETYDFQVQVDTDQAFAGSNFEIVARLPIKKTGYYVIGLDGPTIAKILTGAAFIRTAVNVAGTTPSITYEAFLAPDID